MDRARCVTESSYFVASPVDGSFFSAAAAGLRPEEAGRDNLSRFRPCKQRYTLAMTAKGRLAMRRHISALVRLRAPKTPANDCRIPPHRYFRRHFTPSSFQPRVSSFPILLDFYPTPLRAPFFFILTREIRGNIYIPRLYFLMPAAT